MMPNSKLEVITQQEDFWIGSSVWFSVPYAIHTTLLTIGVIRRMGGMWPGLSDVPEEYVCFENRGWAKYLPGCALVYYGFDYIVMKRSVRWKLRPEVKHHCGAKPSNTKWQ